MPSPSSLSETEPPELAPGGFSMSNWRLNLFTAAPLAHGPARAQAHNDVGSGVMPHRGGSAGR